MYEFSCFKAFPCTLYRCCVWLCGKWQLLGFPFVFPLWAQRKAVCDVPGAWLLMQQCCQVSICLSAHLEDMKLLAGGEGEHARKLKNNPKKVMCVFQNFYLIEKGFQS